ncbi:MAG: hypothetical protein ACXABY_15610, partial [Candidatus Thorarchaeota archaeon]
MRKIKPKSKRLKIIVKNMKKGYVTMHQRKAAQRVAPDSGSNYLFNLAYSSQHSSYPEPQKERPKEKKDEEKEEETPKKKKIVLE